MLRKILDSIMEACVEGYQWGYNLGRYGNPKGPPKPEPKKDIIDEGHKGLAEDIFNSACMTLAETGLMYPTFFLIRGDEFMPIVLDPKTHPHINIKQYASEVISIADDSNAEALMLVSEQWQVKRKITDEEVKKFEEGKLLPSLDPDRQEVLCLIYMSSKGKTQTLFGDIQRATDNTPFVRDSKWSDGDMSTSFFRPWR